MRRMSVLSSIVLVAVAAVTPALGSAQEVGRNVQTWTWDGRVANGNWFRLSSVNGPITVEPSTDNMVHVRAEKVVRRGDVTDVAFEVIQSGGDTRICALWRRSVCDEDGMRSRRNEDDDDNDRRDVQVRFTVKVPAGVRLSAGTVNGEMRVRDLTADVRASTVNGSVEVRNVGGPVKATTVNGGVNVSTRSGPVNASTVNGDIDVRMASLTRTDDMSFTSVNGTVRVETPANLNADVSLGTMHGSISSDFPVTLSGRFGPRNARGTIGRGGQEISMRTVNGSVELRRHRL